MDYEIETGKILPLSDENYDYRTIITYYDRAESCMKYKYMKIKKGTTPKRNGARQKLATSVGSFVLAITTLLSLTGCGNVKSTDTKVESDNLAIEQVVDANGTPLYKITLADGKEYVLDEDTLAEVISDDTRLSEKDTTKEETPATEEVEEIEETSEEVVEEKVILNKEEYEALCEKFIKAFRDRGISDKALSDATIRQFVAIVNIEILAPEVLEEIRDGRDGSQYLTEAMSVMGYASDYNRNYYNKNHSTDGFINFSEAMPEGSYGYNSLKLTEQYRDNCSAVVNCKPLENFTDENGIVHELYEVVDAETASRAYNTIILQFLNELQEPNGSLYGVNNRGCGMAMVLPMFDMTETISRAGAFSPMLINNQNYAQMHAAMTMEGPGSVIRNIYDGACYTPENTMYTAPKHNSSYTRRIGRR